MCLTSKRSGSQHKRERPCVALCALSVCPSSGNSNREQGLRLGAVSTRSQHRRGTIDLNHARKENLNDLSPLNKFWQAIQRTTPNQRTNNTSSKTVKSLRQHDPDASRTVRRKSTVERLNSDNGALLMLYTNTREATNKQLEQCCCVCSRLLHTYCFSSSAKVQAI